MIPSSKTLPMRLGVATVPTLLGASLLFWLLDIDTIFNPPFLLAGLNLLFIVWICLIVSYVSGKSYLETGSATLVMLGTGVLSYGLAFLYGGLAFNVDLNKGVTISVFGYLIASILQAFSATMTWKGYERFREKRRTRLLAGYGGATLFLSAISLAVLTGIAAPFLPIGSLLEQVALVVTMALFGFSSLLILLTYFRSKSQVLYWYCLALALMSTGMLGFVLGGVGDLVGWTGAIANYLGSFLLLTAVFKARNQPQRQ